MPKSNALAQWANRWTPSKRIRWADGSSLGAGRRVRVWAISLSACR